MNGKSCQKGGKKEGGRKERRERERERGKGSAVFPRRPLVNYVFVEPIESHCGAVQKGYKRNVEAAIKAGRKASFYFAKSGASDPRGFVSFFPPLLSFSLSLLPGASRRRFFRLLFESRPSPSPPIALYLFSAFASPSLPSFRFCEITREGGAG